jgi:hypothetical protein
MDEGLAGLTTYANTQAFLAVFSQAAASRCDLQLLCSAELISGPLLLRRVLLSFGDHNQR